MERESFEDEEVAEILNRGYIPVKVDREERPDIDQLYMTYCQVLTGAGGWPLTVLMTPDKQPFFAGTYFPKHSHYGRPGLMDILSQAAELWQTEKDKVIQTAAELYETVTRHYRGDKNATSAVPRNKQTLPLTEKEKDSGDIAVWGKTLLGKGYELLENKFDSKYGGFGSAPKFPAPHNLGFLLRYSLGEPQSKALAMVEKTLDSMADGGIFDHIGFGFARYSTDRYWLVPHFEKMLYDNAGLALVYLEAYQRTKKEKYRRVAQNIFGYVLRDMTSSEGGFYCAEDADSEGEEGKYYLWSKDQIRKTLQEGIKRLQQVKDVKNKFERFLNQPEEIVDIYCDAYGITDKGNYEGKNIPSRIFSVRDDLAFRCSLTGGELDELLNLCNPILFKAREKRVRPAKDDKILVSWNGLMIGALAKGVQVLAGDLSWKNDRESLLLTAENAAGFIMAKMFDPRGRLLARYRDGEAGIPGFLDDYAFLIYGLLELYIACGKTVYLEQAIHLQEEQEKLFWDETNGGYYFTGRDAEELPLRPKEIYDGAMPSGNSMSACNLVRLWRLTGLSKWRERAEKQINSFQSTVEDYPTGYTAFLQAIQYCLSQGEELVLSGPAGHEDLEKMQAVIFKDFHPYAVVAYNDGSLVEVIPRMQDYPVSGTLTAYVCRDYACREPVNTPEELAKILTE
ncbi:MULTISPECIES: thioredoxin domain-containing protein [unclassified Dehalobacter]|uniref:thioredoxin domain-containing protein n=1 Tax=unclassified Dehalobacter TaxID=2635733 RepID=UPI000E6C6A8A|nr:MULTISPECIES: thioredoxin domain-containing protein [unclassified Dehalobacter]RJE48085.1 hypothetical protein A7K50_11460 [Dehalobacter sp. MCB1]TCX49558.1 thioredoxin domain-containing protein [Dehalobacter sp. 14DCB1]TCX50318.1 thioredoxin domain-containing protein [Dehalobacter sp. 12DCB1]